MPEGSARGNGGGTAFEAGAVVQDRRTGQFATGADLTDQQRAFVHAYVQNGGVAVRAAEAAGYAAARQSAYDLTRNPAVARAIREEMSRTLYMEVGAVSISTILGVMRDPGAKNSDRVQAARLGLEAAKIIKRDKADGANPLGDKPLSEMTLSELETFITAGNAALEAKAKGQDDGKTIDGEAVIVDDDAQDDAQPDESD